MSGRRYGQYCGLARAMEMVGERWAMLVVRDLVLGPKTFPQLRDGLRGVPVSVLTARLNELEECNVVQRFVSDGIDATLAYELTEYGRDLEGVVYTLGLWGARSLGDPGPNDMFTRDAAILSLRTMFRSDGQGPVTYVVDYGFVVLTARVDGDEVEVTEEQVPEPDMRLVFHASVKPMLAGEITPARALEEGLLSVQGDRALLDRFAGLFCIPAAPEPSEELALR